MTSSIIQMPLPCILVIAGSDCSSCAGLQADLKTISALGGFAVTVPTILTAQSPTDRSSFALHIPPASFLRQELEAVFQTYDFKAVKVGALGSEENVRLVVEMLRKKHHRHANVVVDPVMETTAGQRLLNKEAIPYFLSSLVPLATLVTPNLPETATLLSIIKAATTEAEMLDHGKSLLQRTGSAAILIKGGHLPPANGHSSTLSNAECPDYLFQTGMEPRRYTAPRMATMSQRGTGCALSSAIATYLALGEELEEAVRKAKHYVGEAMRWGEKLGVVGKRAKGPLDYFYSHRGHLNDDSTSNSL